MDGVYYDANGNLLGIENEEERTRHDLISRCELFNKLALVPAKDDVNEYASKVYSIIQQMPTVDAEDTTQSDEILKVIIRLKSGYELRVDCEKFRITRNKVTGEITHLEWVNVKNINPLFFRIEDVECIYQVVTERSGDE